MPRHTITAVQIGIRAYRGGSDADRLDVAAFDDATPQSDLLPLFRGLCEHLREDKQRLADTRRERYSEIVEVRPEGRTVFVKADTGPYGTAGRVVDTLTGRQEHEYRRTSAAIVPTRLLFAVPKTGTSALLFVERVGLRSSGTALLDPFKTAVNGRFRQHLLITAPVLEADAWLESSELRRITGVRAFNFSPDIADAGDSRALGDLKYTLEADTGASLGAGVFGLLRRGIIRPGQLLGLPDDAIDDLDEVQVEVFNGDTTKVMYLEKQRLPVSRYPLAERDDPFPSDEDFIAACLGTDVGGDLFDRFDVDWSAAWERGDWTPDQLDVSLQLPDER